jgi:adenylate kinase
VCQDICATGDIEHLSASDLLKWTEINEDPKNKKVKDINDTQTRLLHGLNNTIQKDVNYLLDGHFCLLNKDAEISRIPLSLFRSINPIMLCLVTGNVETTGNMI